LPEWGHLALPHEQQTKSTGTFYNSLHPVHSHYSSWCLGCPKISFITTSKAIHMKKNMGNADRLFRVLVAAVIAILYFTNVISGTVGVVLLVLAGVFVLTSLISFCPLYAPFGLSTCPRKS
jgi:hypothetical protein